MDHIFAKGYRRAMEKVINWLDDTLVAVEANRTRVDLLRRASLDRSYSAGGLAVGTGAATVKTANTVTYVIGGVFKSKAATDNIAIPAGTTVPISNFCKFLVSLPAGGTPTLTQGNLGTSAALALLPACPANEAPVGYMQVATDGATTYVPGTTDDPTAGVTFTYVDTSWVDTGADAMAALAATGQSITNETKAQADLDYKDLMRGMP